MTRPVVINRDPFARADLCREAVPMAEPRTPCGWCNRPARFRYGWWSDTAPGPVWRRGAFCSVECYRTFYCEEAP